MTRPQTMLLALFCAGLAISCVTVSSASIAQSTDWIGFTVEPERGDLTKIHASFRDQTRDADRASWSSGFSPSDLGGLDGPSFRGAGSHPIRFALVREAGRLDCSGTAGSGHAYGNCRFTADPRFTQLLENHGIGRPTRDQAFGLMAVNARREVVEAIAAAHYPTPSMDDLMALAALGVDRGYIADMARAGYRPRTLRSLIEFKALGVTPQWIAGLASVGYANVPGDGLVQLRALGVGPEFIAGYQRIGYRNLPADTLVQLKALNITPEFVRSVVREGEPMPPVDDLVELRLFGRRR